MRDAMNFEINFGTLAKPAMSANVVEPERFRIAVLGDFSARANGGRQETGDELAKRKPLKVDVDDLDEVIERLNLRLRLPIAADGGAVDVTITCMDDFHPDQLYEKLNLFSEFASLRRRLTNSSTFAAAAQEVLPWRREDEAERRAPERIEPRGSAIPDGDLNDFAQLIGLTSVDDQIHSQVDELARQLVAPYVLPAKDPAQDEMIAAVDQASSMTMRTVLHHPDFQTVESLWRSVERMTRRLETGSDLQIVLYDITAQEIAADLSSVTALEESGLYRLLVEQPASDAQQGPLSVILGNYTFQQQPSHANLLGRMAKISAAARAPFVAGISADCLEERDEETINPAVRQSWAALREMPEAAYLGLTVPRFLLRVPYGKKTSPIDSFDFEELATPADTHAMLLGNSAVLTGLLLGQTFSRMGLRGMQPGTLLAVEDMPFYWYTDDDGDQVAAPCTEKLLTQKMAEHAASQGFMPVLSIKAQPEVRLGGFVSVAGGRLAGSWTSVGG